MTLKHNITLVLNNTMDKNKSYCFCNVWECLCIMHIIDHTWFQNSNQKMFGKKYMF